MIDKYNFTPAIYLLLLQKHNFLVHGARDYAFHDGFK